MTITPLARALFESGCTQKQIAQAAGLNPNTVASAVRGRHQPRTRTLFALSKALGQPIDTLVTKGGEA